MADLEEVAEEISSRSRAVETLAARLLVAVAEDLHLAAEAKEVREDRLRSPSLAEEVREVEDFPNPLEAVGAEDPLEEVDSLLSRLAALVRVEKAARVPSHPRKRVGRVARHLAAVDLHLAAAREEVLEARAVVRRRARVDRLSMEEETPLACARSAAKVVVCNCCFWSARYALCIVVSHIARALRFISAHCATCTLDSILLPHSPSHLILD